MLIADMIHKQDNQNPEIQAIKAAMKQTKDKRIYQRYRVIYLHLKGYANRDISKVCEHIIGTYISMFKKDGLRDLTQNKFQVLQGFLHQRRSRN